MDEELAVDEPRDDARCCRGAVPLGGRDPSIYSKRISKIVFFLNFLPKPSCTEVIGTACRDDVREC